MKHINVKDTHVVHLRKGKIKGLGFWEKILLKITGFLDGRRGLPREDENGHWTSPHLDKEVHSYDEFSTRMFGQLQIDRKDDYARLSELIDSITCIKTQIQNTKAELDEATNKEEAIPIFRRDGENRLTDAQVVARRSKEQAARLAPIKSRICSLKERLSTEIDEFVRLHNKIIEDNNSTRIVCNRVKNHLLMRLDEYWNSALLSHPDNSKMPAIPSIEITARAEAAYLEPHHVLMQRAELLIQILSSSEQEAA